MISLSVNLNKVALLRNARGADTPSVVAAARTVLNNGGQGITANSRRDHDVHRFSMLPGPNAPNAGDGMGPVGNCRKGGAGGEYSQ